MASQMGRSRSIPPGMNALASNRRPMKWGFVVKPAPLMGRSSLAQGIHAWVVALSNASRSLSAHPEKMWVKVSQGWGARGAAGMPCTSCMPFHAMLY